MGFETGTGFATLSLCGPSTNRDLLQSSYRSSVETLLISMGFETGTGTLPLCGPSPTRDLLQSSYRSSVQRRSL